MKLFIGGQDKYKEIIALEERMVLEVQTIFPIVPGQNINAPQLP